MATRPIDSLEREYASAVYEVDLPTGPVKFRIGGALPQFAGRPFALITAYNPRHRRPSPEENEAANARLAARLQLAGWRLLPARGRSPDGSHVEPSFAVFGIGLDAALLLAGDFGQAAIAWFDGEVARLAWVDPAIPPPAT